MITESGPLVARVNGRDVLSFRSHDRRLSGAAPRLIGETSRRQALAEEIKVAEQRIATLPDIADLRHYILRTRKGFQFKTIESVRKEKEVCEKAIVENRTVLKERLNDPEFGAAFRFIYEEESNELYDFRSRLLSAIIDWQGAEIIEQKEVINDQTKELFRKIIMTELVNYLRAHACGRI